MRTRLMLELGCNHQGDPQLAAQMILDAVKLGVFGVKLQMRDVERIPAEKRNTPRDASNSFGETYYAHRKALEFDDATLLQLKELAEANHLMFMVSVFDMPSLIRAVKGLNIKAIKLPSQFYLAHDMNWWLATHKQEYGLFTARSTGMHVWNEVQTLLYRFNFDITLYCRSIYPHGLHDLDIGFVRAMYENLHVSSRGYSSHDRDGVAIILMVLLGATWVERHYTLDKKLKGSDHHTVSSDYADVEALKRSIEWAETAGSVSNMYELVSAEERAAAEFYRRRA